MNAGANGYRRPRYGGLRERIDVVELRPGVRLTIEELVAVARGDGNGSYPKVELAGDWRERCKHSRDHIAFALKEACSLLKRGSDAESDVLKSLSSGPDRLSKAAIDQEIDKIYSDMTGLPIASKLSLFIYGVTTGFGSNKDKPLFDEKEISDLQRNILLSHSVGTGDTLPTEVVRAMILLRIRTFIEGRSGVRDELINLLVDMLNKQVHPVVPSQGSVGASGDLCPLAHIGITLLGEGYAWVGDRGIEDLDISRYVATPNVSATPYYKPPMSSRDALAAVGLEPLKELAVKEGLAITNGTVMSAALTALSVYDADVLIGTANLCGALTLQAMLGFSRAYDAKVHEVRLHPSQAETAKHVMSFAGGSKLLNRAREVQDPYSLRCIPQVHGAVLAAIEHVWEITSREINAVTDNPLFFVEQDEAGQRTYPEEKSVCLWDAYSGGNFHGEPIALAADYLKMAIAELASISERRGQLLLDSKHNRGLPENLPLRKAGVNNGLMIAQYTASGLVSENKILAHPAVVDSIPSSANSEDHVSMSSISSRHLRQVLDNVRNVLAIELILALQALELHTRLSEHADPKAVESYRYLVQGSLSELLSAPCKRVFDFVREELEVAFIADDVQLWNLVAVVQRSIQQGDILQSATGFYPYVRPRVMD